MKFTSVAALRMVAVSASSTKNVLWPARILSDAPTRVNIRSTGVITQLSAGTLDPRNAVEEVSKVK